MANTPLSLVMHNTKSELYTAYKSSKNPIEKIRLQLIWMARSKIKKDTSLSILPEEGAKRIGMSADWARRTIRTYNKEGITGLSDARKNNGNKKILPQQEQKILKGKIETGKSGDGGRWTGPKVAKYMGEVLGKKISAVTGWNYLISLGYSIQVPRLAHEKRATKAEQNRFKKNSALSQRKRRRKIQKGKSKSGQKTKLD